MYVRSYMCVCVYVCARAQRCPVSDGSIDMQDRDNRLPHSSRRSDAARFEYGQRGPSIVHDAYEASALQIRLCHIPRFCHCIPYISLSLFVCHAAVRTCERSSAHAIHCEISPSSCFSSSSSSCPSSSISSSSSSLKADLENCFFISPRSRIRHEPLDTTAIHRQVYRSDRIYREGPTGFFYSSVTRTGTDSSRKGRIIIL